MYDVELAQRVRGALSGQHSVREVPMFGGLSFMVDDRMILSAGSQGDLMVNVGQERVEELIAARGARLATMRGRVCKGWLFVDAQETRTPGSLTFWVNTALDHSRQQPACRPRPRSRRSTSTHA